VAWSYQENARCPRCSHQHETTLHVQRCKGHGVCGVFQKSLDKLDNYLINEETKPELRDAILRCLKMWRNQEPIRLKEFPPEVRTLIQQQHNVGWLAFTEGLLVKGWRRTQRQYIQEEGLKRSSTKWTKGLLIGLHHLNHNQWKHRCDIKVSVNNPQEQEGQKLLHDLIEREFLLGTEGLSVGDKDLLNCSVLQLMRRSLTYKKGWITRVHAARQRAARIAANNDELVLQSKGKSRLYQWLETHSTREMRMVKRYRIDRREGEDLERTAPAAEDIEGEETDQRGGETVGIRDQGGPRNGKRRAGETFGPAGGKRRRYQPKVGHSNQDQLYPTLEVEELEE
jgi:hypothetical protein